MSILTLLTLKSFLAGIVASVACGLGALPLLWKRLDPRHHTALGYAFAGGLMFSASVYNLILPGLTMRDAELSIYQVGPVVFGILLGALFLSTTDRMLSEERLARHAWSKWGSRNQILIFVAMTIHSIPEGVAVGVGYASEEVYNMPLGSYIALAIAIHNIPEGLAVAVPLRAEGASIKKCFWAAFLTGIPQPLAAVPACLVSWFFKPFMPVLMGFAAGAMIFLVLLTLLPDALAREKPIVIAWAFTLGFCLMLGVQILL